MSLFCIRSILTAVTLAAAVTLSLSSRADAESACNRREIADLLPRLPQGCHAERITAAGELSYGIVRSADYLARRAWQRQVLDKYGERFQRWELAACAKVECVPGSLAGSKRCTYAGFPCSPDVDMKVLADLKEDRGGPGADDRYERERVEREDHRELNQAEITELQRLLKMAGFSVSLDGDFGEKTSEALIKWQHKAGVPEDGMPTVQNLERLRHAHL
jgi:hypothetical protein